MASSSQDSVSVHVSPKLIQISEDAPLARQESLEDMSKAGEHQVLMNGDHHEAEDVVDQELRHVVIVKESPACEVISAGAGSRPPPDVRVQISLPQPTTQTKVEESPINEPIVIVKHKAQVLQPSENDESVLEKLLESDGTESNAESSRLAQAEGEESVDIEDRRIKYSAAKKLSQDLIVTVENAPDDELKVTEKLPEVLLVAEQLPERLKTGKNILSRSETSKEDNKEKDPTAPPYESSEMDDGGSTLTFGRTDTITEVTDGLQVEARPEAGGEQPRSEARVKTVRHEVALENETSCLSPFFVGLYSSLGVLIIIMIGLNFWFGFHLLFFVGLLAVIALFGCILTEFNDFHNEPD